ncbi:MAG: DUF481 domain-containing protein [Candidatus Krumholzibacteria bacterium]|nr:DUF481 domain-containing protein [Candidatus Krumholzibacteria bacterium]
MYKNVHRVLIMALAILALTAGFAAAQEDAWTPPPPSDGEKDWIRLSSGEWLWGTIDLMRDESLEFDSEEMDEVTIDWVDVVEIRSARAMTYVKLDGSMVTGTSTMKGKTILIETTGGVVEIPRSQIQSILEGEPTELNFWSAKVGVDLKTRTGNTNQKDFGARVFIKREAARSRIDVRYQGNFSKTNDEENVRNNRGNIEWKVFLSRKFFVSPVKLEFFSDKFQNIDERLTVGAGVGYYISRSSKADWFVELGGAYQETRWRSVEPGEDEKESNGSVPFRTTLETDITKKTELTAEYGVQVGLGHEANTIHHTFVMFEIDVWGDIDFDMSVTWDHVTRPKTNAEGITPLKDDVATYFGLSIDF